MKNKIFISLCFIYAFAFTGNALAETTTYIHFIDVGQGDSILIDYGDFEILIDGGYESKGDFVRNYLSDKVDGNLEILVATHPDADHIGGLATILDYYVVETIIDSGKTHTTKTYKNYIEAVKNEENAIFLEDDDMVFEIGENVVFTVIEIVDGEDDNNSNSIICRLDINEVSFLFTGDLGHEMEREYLNKFEAADVIKVGHHGSKNATSPEFINKINPKYAVISCGANNRYGHPRPQTLDTLNKNNIITYRTDLQGTIIAETNGKNIAFTIHPTQTHKTVSPQTSQPATIENAVYVTQSGSKYHIEGCYYLRKSSIAITLDEAIKEYEPCSRCD